MDDAPAELVTVLEEVAVVGLIIAVATAVIIGFITWLLLKAADKPPGSMVTLSLGLLTIFALVSYSITREEVMAAVVGTGIGALAGAVTYQLAGGKPKETDDDHAD